MDTIAVAAALVVAVSQDLPLKIAETGSWLNLVAGTTFPLLAALMLRPGADGDDRPARLRRLAILFVGFGVLWFLFGPQAALALVAVALLAALPFALAAVRRLDLRSGAPA